MKHELDESGQPIHIDVDPFIPTGICAICVACEQKAAALEDRSPA